MAHTNRISNLTSKSTSTFQRAVDLLKKLQRFEETNKAVNIVFRPLQDPKEMSDPPILDRDLKSILGARIMDVNVHNMRDQFNLVHLLLTDSTGIERDLNLLELENSGIDEPINLDDFVSNRAIGAILQIQESGNFNPYYNDEISAAFAEDELYESKLKGFEGKICTIRYTPNNGVDYEGFSETVYKTKITKIFVSKVYHPEGDYKLIGIECSGMPNFLSLVSGTTSRDVEDVDGFLKIITTSDSSADRAAA